VAWALAGAGLLLLSDWMFERLFLLGLVPWIGWAIAGLVLFGLAIFRAHRDRWRPLSLLLASSPLLALPLLWLSAGPLHELGKASVCCEHPSDGALIEAFRVHRQEFERLREMFSFDPQLGRVAPTFTRSASFYSGAPTPAGPPVSADRLREYRSLFKALGLDAGIEGYDDKQTIFFHASSLGLAVSGSGKGYVYTTRPPQPLVPTLEKSFFPGEHIMYRHLEGNWYLYLSAD
jgi:hypothetical protein